MSENERRLTQSWQANAQGWIDAVRECRIDSRCLVTDAAMLDAALALSPQRALDIGCGEGWLCRALSAHGVQMVGVDAQPMLIDAARLAGGGQFHVCRHADLHAAQLGRFDLLLCNFALLEEQLQPLLHSWHELLQPGGRLLIQTLHPLSACAEQAYRDGWRMERFTGMGEGFPEAMPWYFRTLESWLALVAAAGWQLVARSEPPHPQSGIPASLLLELARPESG